MIITLSKVKLLSKLKAAREVEIKRCEKLNAAIDDDFERDRKKTIEAIESVLQRVRTTVSGVDLYHGLRDLAFQRRAKAQPETDAFDHAIYLLENAKENEVRIDTNRDKYGLDSAIRKALGIRR